MKLKAYAKINLTLNIIGKREDGYHEIDSIMQSISLFDEVTLTPKSFGIEIKTPDLRLPLGPKNTTYKAAQLFFDRTGVESGVVIEIEKMIPVAAGLAGGSADAAAVLVGLNRLFKSNLSESDIQILAASVGSDVPFCCVGGTCRSRGRGELVERIEDLPEIWFVLVNPDFEIKTKWVYENFDLVWIKEKRMVGTHIPITSINLYNDLEKVVLPKYPVLERLKRRLIQLKCLQALMSGSGPTIFGMAPDEETAIRAVADLRQDFPQTYVVESIPRSLEVIP